MQKRPMAGDNSPWGMIQYTVPVAHPDAVYVSTAGHGGIWIAPHLRSGMPEGYRKQAWFEEDCEWAIVEITYPGSTLERVAANDPERREKVRQVAMKTLEMYYPELAKKMA